MQLAEAVTYGCMINACVKCSQTEKAACRTTLAKTLAEALWELSSHGSSFSIRTRIARSTMMKMT